MRIGKTVNVQSLDSYTRDCLIRSCKPYDLNPDRIKNVKYLGLFLGMFKMYEIPNLRTSFIVR